MLKEASKILEIIVEFCRENMNMLMIAGVALIVLVIVIAIARPSKGDEDFDFDEFTKKLDGDEEKPSTPEQTKQTEKPLNLVCVEQPPKTAAVEAPLEVKESKQQEQTPVFTKNTVSLGAIVEELAELSGDGVKKVEIRIPGAEVKITYFDEEEEVATETPQEEKIEEVVNDLEEKEPIQESESEPETATAPKKFGPDNMNVTRSGKVYSEEELQKQIRD